MKGSMFAILHLIALMPHVKLRKSPIRLFKTASCFNFIFQASPSSTSIHDRKECTDTIHFCFFNAFLFLNRCFSPYSAALIHFIHYPASQLNFKNATFRAMFLITLPGFPETNSKLHIFDTQLLHLLHFYLAFRVLWETMLGGRSSLQPLYAVLQA